MANASNYDIFSNFQTNLGNEGTFGRLPSAFTVDSGNPQYSGTGLDLSSCTLSLALTETGSLFGPPDSPCGIRFGVTVGASATSGVIFSVEYVDNNKMYCAAVYNAGTNQVIMYSWNGTQVTSASIPTTVTNNSIHDYQYANNSVNTIYRSFDGIYQGTGTWSGYSSQWTGYKGDNLVLYIGKSVNGSLPASNALTTLTAAGDVTLEYLYGLPDNEGNPVSSDGHTPIGELTLDVPVTDFDKASIPFQGGKNFSAEIFTTNAEVSSIGKGGAGGPSGPVIKEFWS